LIVEVAAVAAILLEMLMSAIVDCVLSKDPPRETSQSRSLVSEREEKGLLLDVMQTIETCTSTLRMKMMMMMMMMLLLLLHYHHHCIAEKEEEQAEDLGEQIEKRCSGWDPTDQRRQRQRPRYQGPRVAQPVT